MTNTGESRYTFIIAIKDFKLVKATASITMAFIKLE